MRSAPRTRGMAAAEVVLAVLDRLGPTANAAMVARATHPISLARLSDTPAVVAEEAMIPAVVEAWAVMAVETAAHQAVN